jgi:hypothetical protein
MDLQSGYHQLPLREEDRQKTTFVTTDRIFQFKVLPFGVAKGPSTFQSTMCTMYCFRRTTLDIMPRLPGRHHSLRSNFFFSFGTS